jgi:hypothetical protein
MQLTVLTRCDFSIDFNGSGNRHYEVIRSSCGYPNHYVRECLSPDRH